MSEHDGTAGSPEGGLTRRRTLLAGAGVLGLAAVGSPALAACSSASGSSSSSPSPVTVKQSDVPVGGGVIEPASNVVVVQPTAGSFKAYSAICPHLGCAVDKIAGGIIQCPCHGSSFKVSDGSVVTGPAQQGLTTMTATVSGSDVVVS